MKLGFDIGSTTIKVIAINDKNEIIFDSYERHLSNVRELFKELLEKAYEALGDVPFTAMITGSGGVNVSELIDVPFIQEVISTAHAIEKIAPKTDVAIELGGEDAKIVYFRGGLEQRMNGICAGGTGAFIDQMAALLQTDAIGLNEYAKNYSVIYPIASRCGVFAKSDIQPLMNEGARKEDLSASIFQSIVNQTISGLACGKPIRGNVAFLGGPLHYLSELRLRFIETLSLTEDQIILPEKSNLFAALGAALSSENGPEFRFDEILGKLHLEKKLHFEVARLEPLFKDDAEYAEFKKRHSKNNVLMKDINKYKGNAYLGVDAGSTTTKVILTDEEGNLLYSFYEGNAGNPLNATIKALKSLYENMNEDIIIKNSCVTGYGEALIQAALKVDIGEIETVAHFKAAQFFQPKVDFILDIGGQDMKCIRIKNGVIEDILLNEACSAGCGSFIESFAKSLNSEISDFAKLAIESKNPIDLGSRCTVFMNSSVKQAQKEGASVADISAGLSYSVIKNALYKVIKLTHADQMGENVVVQGGTFYNESVLRAFEKISGKEVIISNIPGLMGAYGASIIARETAQEHSKSALLSIEDINQLSVDTQFRRCKSCTNNCLLTINKFNKKESYISGNRCERGIGKERTDSNIPNLYKYKLKRLFEYESLDEKEAARGIVGIPRVLNIYENYPLWHSFFTKLKYRVVLSPPSTKKIYELGMESIPSESVCYPAKIAHGHIVSLINDGIKFIFYPSVAYETKEYEDATNHYNCPIVTSYPENIKNNMEELRDHNIDYRNPFVNLDHYASLEKRLIITFPEIPEQEIKDALSISMQEQEKFRKDIQKKGEETLEYINEHGIRGIVLAGRPYHVDPEINHGIPEMITSYKVAVLTEDSVSHLGDVERPLWVCDQWAYHSRLYGAASYVKSSENLDLIQLNSFGCGLDAVTTDEVSEILRKWGKVYTTIKIDEVNSLGAARIRLRSLFAAQKDREKIGLSFEKAETSLERVIFTKEMRKDYTLLCPQMSPLHFNLLESVFNDCGYNLVVMPTMDKESIDVGLRYVNNDACYPAIIVVGQIMRAINSGKYDPNKVAVLMSQSGGGCRATNYVGFIRKALKNADLSQIPVVSISAIGIEENPGFKLSLGLLNKGLQAAVLGDLFMRVLFRTRPYEKIKGSADALYHKWNEICRKSLKNGRFREYSKNVRGIISEFDNLPLTDEIKPRVGVVGEILVKFHPTANNDIVALLEAEGAEAVVPDLVGFLLYSAYNATFKEEYFGFKKIKTITSNALIKIIEIYQNPMVKALRKSKIFVEPVTIRELGNMAEPIVSLCNQTGEGWFLTAEMVELIHDGVPNIICTQPFACLPNHVTGKGVIKELKRKHPLSNIVAIDYDPGASEVNQLNRIRLMLSTATKNLTPVEHIVTDKDSVELKGQSEILKSNS